MADDGDDSTQRIEDELSPVAENGPRHAGRRRLSVQDKTSGVISHISNTLDVLNDLWNKIELDESARLVRVSAAYGHIITLCDDMKSAEAAMVANVQEQCRAFAGKVVEMRKELHLAPFAFDNYTPESLKLWKALEMDVKDLKAKREVLLKEQIGITERFESLIFRLGEDLANVTTLSIPSANALAPRRVVAELRERSEEMEKTLTQRMELFRIAQIKMKEWTTRMRWEPPSEIRNLLDADPEDDDYPLTEDFMKQLEEHIAKVESQYSEWLDGLQSQYDEKMQRLDELWQACFVPEAQRVLSAKFDPSSQDADSIFKVQDEIDRLEDYYTLGKTVLEALGTWQAHWNQKLEYDRSANDVNKYNNRGGNLDRMLKHETALRQKLLPNAKVEVARAWELHQEHNPDSQLLIGGMSPVEYIENIESEYELEKQMEKDIKASAKKQREEIERKWGSKTPQQDRRRPLPNGPQSLGRPVQKKGRMDDGAELSHFFGGTAHSFMSVVSPRRAEKAYPKTSSPKGSALTLFSPGKATKGQSSSSATPKPFRPIKRKL